jgi:hypothetical protein
MSAAGRHTQHSTPGQHACSHQGTDDNEGNTPPQSFGKGERSIRQTVLLTNPSVNQMLPLIEAYDPDMLHLHASQVPPVLQFEGKYMNRPLCM